MSFVKSHFTEEPGLEPLPRRLPVSVGALGPPGIHQSLATKLSGVLPGSVGTAYKLNSIHPELEEQQLDRRVRVVLSWMEANLGTSVSLEHLAMLLNISASRLRHLFKEETGNTPLHHLKIMRLLRARELLLDSFLSLKQVMNLVGITDISHFVKDYKILHGETPARTRTTYRGARSRE